MKTIEVFHASPVADIKAFRELSHFGTRDAALQRAARWEEAFLYRVALKGARILRVPDFSPADDRGAVHSWMRLVDQLHYDVKPRVLGTVERDAVFAAGASCADGAVTRFNAGLADQRLAILLLRQWDLLSYENKVEDPGNLSYILLDPASANVLDCLPIASSGTLRKPGLRP